VKKLKREGKKDWKRKFASEKGKFVIFVIEREVHKIRSVEKLILKDGRFEL
jgi:hypothetical protein